jgi:hypothetical protein
MNSMKKCLLAAGLVFASQSLVHANHPFGHRMSGYGGFGMMPVPMMPMPLGIGMMGMPAPMMMGGGFSMSMPATLNLNMTLTPGMNFGLGGGLFNNLNNQQLFSSADMLFMFATRFANSPAGSALIGTTDPETRKILEALAVTAKQLDARMGKMEETLNRAVNNSGNITPEMLQNLSPAERANLAGRLELMLKMLRMKEGS